MSKDQPEQSDFMVVNKATYIAALRASGALLEQLSETFEHFRKEPGYNKETKRVTLQVLAETIKTVSLISQGFEESMLDRLGPGEGKLIN